MAKDGKGFLSRHDKLTRFNKSLKNCEFSPCWARWYWPMPWTTKVKHLRRWRFQLRNSDSKECLSTLGRSSTRLGSLSTSFSLTSLESSRTIALCPRHVEPIHDSFSLLLLFSPFESISLCLQNLKTYSPPHFSPRQPPPST